MRAIRRVEIPAGVREFAEGIPLYEESAAVTEAREVMRAAVASRPVLYVCGRWAGWLVAPGASAWTLGRRVLMRAREWGVDRTDALVAHELVHVAQWSRRGRAGFLVSYLGAYLRARMRGLGHWAAYREIPAEVEAYDIEAIVEPYL